MIIRKVRGNKPSTNVFKQRKKIKEFDKCCDCGRKFHKYELEIEHEIPVCLGGDINKIMIICKSCHKDKTRMDNYYINFVKNIGLLKKIGPYEYEIDKNKVSGGYKLMFWNR